MTNTGTAAVDVTMSTDNNLGSDSATVITATSSGDLTWEPADLWMTTGRDFEDPRLGQVLQGAGAPIGVASVVLAPMDDGPEWEYDTFSLAAGETAIIMFVVTGQPTNTAAASQAAAIAALDGSVTDGLTVEDAALIQNFKVALCDTSADCDDGNPCNGTETCVAVCMGGEPLVCAGGAACDPVTGCPGGTGGTGGAGGAGGCAASRGPANGTTGVLFLAVLGWLAIRRRRRA